MSTGSPASRQACADADRFPIHPWIACTRSSGSLISSVCPSHAITPANCRPSCSSDCAGQRHDRAAGLDAGPVHADIELDENGDFDADGLGPPRRVPPVSRCCRQRSSHWRGAAARRCGRISARPLPGWRSECRPRRPRPSLRLRPVWAQVTPSAPAAIILCAIAGIFIPFVCGRQSTPASRKLSISSAMLHSSISRSTHSVGVSSVSFARPISVIRYPHALYYRSCFLPLFRGERPLRATEP